MASDSASIAVVDEDPLTDLFANTITIQPPKASRNPPSLQLYLIRHFCDICISTVGSATYLEFVVTSLRNDIILVSSSPRVPWRQAQI